MGFEGAKKDKEKQVRAIVEAAFMEGPLEKPYWAMHRAFDSGDIEGALKATKEFISELKKIDELWAKEDIIELNVIQDGLERQDLKKARSLWKSFNSSVARS